MKVPTYNQVRKKWIINQNDSCLDPMELFIHNFFPWGEIGADAETNQKQFRKQLQDLVNYVEEEKELYIAESNEAGSGE